MLAWNFMPQFRGLDLSESFVLGWTMGEDLVFEVEFVLTAEHPSFTTPTPTRAFCYRRGRLRFPRLRQLTGLPDPADLPASVDASGERDFGKIDDLAEGPDGYEIVGEFGHVVLLSEEPLVELEGAA